MSSTSLPSDPPYSATEFETLTSFLDWYRIVMIRKIEGLDAEGLRRSAVGSGTSLGGLVKHLAYVERHWFGTSYGGLELDYPWTDEDPDADFRLDAEETVESLIAFYQAECTRSRQIVASKPDLDHVVPASRGTDGLIEVDPGPHDRGNGPARRPCRHPPGDSGRRRGRLEKTRRQTPDARRQTPDARRQTPEGE